MWSSRDGTRPLLLPEESARASSPSLNGCVWNPDSGVVESETRSVLKIIKWENMGNMRKQMGEIVFVPKPTASMVVLINSNCIISSRGSQIPYPSTSNRVPNHSNQSSELTLVLRECFHDRAQSPRVWKTISNHEQTDRSKITRFRRPKWPIHLPRRV